MRFKKGTAVLGIAFSGVAPAPSRNKYNKTFHSATDFSAENPFINYSKTTCFNVKNLFLNTLIYKTTAQKNKNKPRLDRLKRGLFLGFLIKFYFLKSCATVTAVSCVASLLKYKTKITLR
ncbi:hypothetical protein [Flavobacterium sp.]|uniref:hypothetical protein n=1 Tax=Flavobacterium sp. TaxID=239 RepID=UPI00262FC038|nr:hypothetical protein [Flavobacterium sp.]MDD3004645.1 hypothetical protein [Flavobacterium sp.]